MSPSDTSRLKALEDRNRRLKKLLAASMLDVSALRGPLRNKLASPAAGRAGVLRLMVGHGLLQRRACGLIEVDPKTVRRLPNPDAPEIRRLIYTTNAIESLRRGLRKIIKTRGYFPNDQAASKLLFLAIRNIEKGWKSAPKEWLPALNQFNILFGERLRGEA